MKVEELDREIQTLQEHKRSWAMLPVRQKAQMIDLLLKGELAVADCQVARAVEAKGIPPDSPGVAEEWLIGPLIILRYLRLISRTLKQIAIHGAPQIPPKKVSSRPDGQLVVNVLPASIFDRILWSARAEVWMEPELRREDLDQSIAPFYRQVKPAGKVVLILGAGNVSCIDPIGVVYKMFVEGAVCLLKPNPVNEYLGALLEEAFGSLVKGGYLRVVYGGGDVGRYLCQHPGIDEIHITGGVRTHDAIVFGTGPEGAERKRLNQPRLNKPITSELGNVSPIIVIPGRWSQRDIRFQAENIASQLANNAGFNCNATRVLITNADWPQHDAFLNAARETFQKIPPRRAYYPGANERYTRVMQTHPNAETFGSGEGTLPWTMITGVNPEARNDICFTEESFCSVFAETAFSATDVADFLRKAVEFCNNTIFGTLNAGIIVDPKTATQLGSSLESAIADLHYGTIGVNFWPGLNFGFGTTTWGAFPGSNLGDIQSGIGVVHNSLMFSKAQKTVLYGPFRLSPKPVWFATNKAANKLAPKAARFEAHPRWFSLLPLFWYALQG